MIDETPKYTPMKNTVPLKPIPTTHPDRDMKYGERLFLFGFFMEGGHFSDPGNVVARRRKTRSRVKVMVSHNQDRFNINLSPNDKADLPGPLQGPNATDRQNAAPVTVQRLVRRRSLQAPTGTCHA